MYIGHTKAKYALISILTRPGPAKRFSDAYISETISARKLKFRTHIIPNNQFKLIGFGINRMDVYRRIMK